MDAEKHLQELAMAKRRAIRETALLGAAAYLEDEQGVFGPPVMQITPWHWLMLLGHDNVLFRGGIPSVRDVLQYLWICSPQFWNINHKSNGSRKSHRSHWATLMLRIRYRWFCWRWRNRLSTRFGATRERGPTRRVLNAIRAHQAHALLDMPIAPPRLARSGEPGPMTEAERDRLPHELAIFELRCREHLNYTAADFWSTPIAHTNQLLYMLAYSGVAAPGTPTFDPIKDKQIGEYLRARKAQHRDQQ